MTTLTRPPVSSLLDELFREADRDDVRAREGFAALDPKARAALHEDYRTLYGEHAKERFLAVSRETGRMLYVLARSRAAKTIVEFGTSYGISTLHLAAALHDNGGGSLVTCELEPAKAARARAHLERAGLASLVEVRVGDALETLARDVPTPIDLVLLDGAKILYPKILALLEGSLRPGALVVADNAETSPAYLSHVRSSGAYVSVPFGGDVEVSVRV